VRILRNFHSGWVRVSDGRSIVVVVGVVVDAYWIELIWRPCGLGSAIDIPIISRALLAKYFAAVSEGLVVGV
jgi:hypothetical protein